MNMNNERERWHEKSTVWYRNKITSGRHLNIAGKNTIRHKRNMEIVSTDREPLSRI